MPRERIRSDFKMSKPTLISSTGSAAKDTRSVSPMPSANNIPNPEIDAELIALTARLWKDLGIFDHVTLQLNSIGSLEARKNYRQALVDFLQNHIDILDEDSKRRLTTNPLRILDSKDQRVQEVLNDAPKLHDYLDNDSLR